MGEGQPLLPSGTVNFMSQLIPIEHRRLGTEVTARANTHILLQLHDYDGIGDYDQRIRLSFEIDYDNEEGDQWPAEYICCPVDHNLPSPANPPFVLAEVIPGYGHYIGNWFSYSAREIRGGAHLPELSAVLRDMILMPGIRCILLLRGRVTLDAEDRPMRTGRAGTK